MHGQDCRLISKIWVQTGNACSLIVVSFRYMQVALPPRIPTTDRPFTEIEVVLLANVLGIALLNKGFFAAKASFIFSFTDNCQKCCIVTVVAPTCNS